MGVRVDPGVALSVLLPQSIRNYYDGRLGTVEEEKRGREVCSVDATYLRPEGRLRFCRRMRRSSGGPLKHSGEGFVQFSWRRGPRVRLG